MNEQKMLCVLGDLPPNPRDLSHCGQRQVALAGRETLGLHAHCTCLRHRLGAQVASQYCPILRSSTFSTTCGSLLRANFCSIFSGILKLSVSLLVDRLLFTRQHVARGDVAYGTVKATIVVIARELLDDALCILERQRALRSNTIALESSVIAFDFSVTLWVVGTCANVSHAAETNDLKSLAMNCGTLVGDKSRIPIV